MDRAEETEGSCGHAPTVAGHTKAFGSAMQAELETGDEGRVPLMPALLAFIGQVLAASGGKSGHGCCSLLPLQGQAPVDAVSIVPGDETILVEAVQFSDRVLVLMAGAGKIITKGMVGRVNGEVLDRVHIVLVSQFVEAGCGFLILFARKKRHCVLPFFCWQPRDRMTRGHWTF